VLFRSFSPLSNHYTEAPFKHGPTTYSSTEQYYFSCKAREMGYEDSKDWSPGVKTHFLKYLIILHFYKKGVVSGL
jgi:hypothetical protein